MPKRICFYHKGCSDGIAASWCFQRKYPSVKLIAIVPQDNNIDINELKDKKVYFVDVCTNEKHLLNIIKVAKKVTIMDHHEIYQNIFANIKETFTHNVKMMKKINITFDKTRSACQIVWDSYFEEKPPLFIDYIADRDLWQFKLPNSKDVNNAMFHLSKINHSSLTELAKLTDDEFNLLIKEEYIPFSKIKQQLDDISLSFGVKNAQPCIINTKTKHKGWIMSNVNPTLKSELGNKLVNKTLPDGSKPKFAVLYQYSIKHKEWWLSFRGNGSLNLSELCKEIDPNGGGHPNAAGLTLKDYDKSCRHLYDLFEIL